MLRAQGDEEQAVWADYLVETGQVFKEGKRVGDLLQELDGLSKVDKLALVNTLPVTKGDLHLVLGERDHDEKALIEVIKRYKR